MQRSTFFGIAVLLLMLILSLLPYKAEAVAAMVSDKKIAFLYMSRGVMPLEEIWHEFFRWRANASHYTIYNHVHRGYSFPRSSFFYGKELKHEALEPLGAGGHLWGNMAQVRAIRALVREALKDPLNQWFLLMSESCIPLFNFNRIRNALLHHDKSIINACPDMGIKEMEGDTRWRHGLDEVGFQLKHWRKSATWFALKREHASVFAEDESTDRGWEKVPCVDEHFLPSMLARHGLDNETSCSDGLTHVHWASVNDAHPTTYGADSITPELFQHLTTDQSGFAATLGLSTCTGIPGMCHIMARKFSAAAKYSLLENIDLMLSDDENPYEGNPWDHHQDKFRRNVTSEGEVYYLIENGFLRKIPDRATLAALHHLRIDDEKGADIHTQLLTPMDLLAYPIKNPVPSRRDGLVVKGPKNREVFVLDGGKRRSIPNMDTMYHLKIRFEDIKVLPDDDLKQISLGEPMPDVNKNETVVRHPRHKRKEAHSFGDHKPTLHLRPELLQKIEPNSTSSDSNAIMNLEKWLYQSEVTDTNEHLDDVVRREEGILASAKTLLEKEATASADIKHRRLRYNAKKVKIDV